QRFGFFEQSHEVGSRVFKDTTDAFGAFAPRVPRDTATRRLIRGLCNLPGGACPFFDLEQELAGLQPLSFETAASISGGTDNTQYFATGTVKDDGGIIANTGFQRQALRLNLDQKLGGRFRTSLNTSYMHTLAQRGLTNNDNSGTSFYVVLSSTPSFVNLGRQPGDTFARNPFVPSNPVQTAALMKNNENVDAGTTIRIGEFRSRIKDLGFFAQEEFLAREQRILLTAGIRADQSSLNADPTKLFYFPKASAAYRLLRPLSAVDEFKVRVA